MPFAVLNFRMRPSRSLRDPDELSQKLISPSDPQVRLHQVFLPRSRSQTQFSRSHGCNGIKGLFKELFV
jgi:hypothetical protein